MISCLVIFGEPNTGKSFTLQEISKILNCKAFSFDYFISFISELLRLSQKNLLNESLQNNFFPEKYFETSEDFKSFQKEMKNLILKNQEFFKPLYDRMIKYTIPNKQYDPKIHDSKDVINLGLIGDSMEKFADQILSSFFKNLVKDSTFFILEGFYFNKGKLYRLSLEKFCTSITFLESFFNPKSQIAHYIINDKKCITVSNLDQSESIRKPRKKYQSFSEKEIGDSKSFLKIDQLMIPANLNGKKVLDLGCNEGFYCFECEKKGAFVVGIEKNKIWHELAIEHKKQLSSSAIFINSDWNEISNIPYTFDLVLFLAAFHYALNSQLTLLKNIYSKMNSGGLLILEAGLSEKNEKEFFIEEYTRPSGEICQYPNKLSITHLLKDAGFSSIDFIGDRYKMPGDKFPRFIIHVTK